MSACSDLWMSRTLFRDGFVGSAGRTAAYFGSRPKTSQIIGCDSGSASTHPQDAHGDTRSSVQFLESVLQTELQLAIGQAGTGDFSEITIAQVLVRIRELWCVKRVEKLYPKLQ